MVFSKSLCRFRKIKINFVHRVNVVFIYKNEAQEQKKKKKKKKKRTKVHFQISGTGSNPSRGQSANSYISGTRATGKVGQERRRGRGGGGATSVSTAVEAESSPPGHPICLCLTVEDQDRQPDRGIRSGTQKQ